LDPPHPVRTIIAISADPSIAVRLIRVQELDMKWPPEKGRYVSCEMNKGRVLLAGNSETPLRNC
jgi:hypothetical protein